MAGGRALARFDMRVDDPKDIQRSFPEVAEIVTPYATVRVSASGRKWSSSLGLVVDSGAVISVFPKSLCEEIGLPLNQGKYLELQTAGDATLPLWVHKVWLQVGETTLDGVYAGFRTNDKGRPLLGRLGVFDAFRVLVRTRARETLFLEEILNGDASGSKSGTMPTTEARRVP